MFVRLMARQTCESVIKDEEFKEHDLEGPDLSECRREMPPGEVALVVHGRDTIEVYCRPCAKKRFGLARE